MPDVAFDPQQVLKQVRQEQETRLAELRQAVAGLPEEKAGEKLATGAWSVKEALAHLILSERFTQRWFADLIVGTTAGQAGGNPTAAPEMLAAVIAGASTTEALLVRLEREMEETVAIFAALRPEIIAMKARYRAMGHSLLTSIHIQSHIDQIRAAVAAIAEGKV
jgi:hypothetical protein